MTGLLVQRCPVVEKSLVLGQEPEAQDEPFMYTEGFPSNMAICYTESLDLRALSSMLLRPAERPV